MTWCAARDAAAEHKTYSNMISFGVMTVLLVVMACVVHYDLFGLFPTYPYGRHARNAADERRQQKQQPEPEQKQQYYEPVQSAIDDVWIPRPGTDPHSQFQRPTIVVHDYGDYRTGASDYWMDDDYWTEVTDVENDDRALDRDDDDDDDESWTEVTTDADDSGGGGGADGTGRTSAGSGVRADGAAGGDTCQAPPRSPVAASTGCDGVTTVVGPPLTPQPSVDDDYYEYDEDYMAPGEERDDDVF